MRPVPRLRGAALPLLVTAVIAAACGSSGTPGGSDASPQPDDVIQVTAGVNATENQTVAVMEFLPESIAVATGTKVRWTAPGPEPHTITFMANGAPPPEPGSEEGLELEAPAPAAGPFDGTTTISSGIGPMGPDALTFDVEFGKAGTYSYVCILHPLMTGTVEVVDDEAEAESQADIDARGESEKEQYLKEGLAAAKKLAETPAASKKNADGSTTWTIEMGVGTEHTEVLTFQPTRAGVKAGDTVTFVNNSNVPHTATFGPEGEIPKDPNDEKSTKPAPGPAPQKLSAGTYVNTGWLPPNAPPGQVPLAARTYSVTVPDAGTYKYVCILHVPSGMEGVVTAT